MGVLRQLNVLGQMRLDVPHLRSMESAIAADFDLGFGRVMAGDAALIVRGFTISMNGAIGNLATNLQLVTAGGTLLHALASEAGTLFSVADDAPLETLSVTNSRVVGGFTANTDNFIGIDLRRTADATTSDVVMFIDANTKLQTPKTIPLARTLDFRIVISTTDFAATPQICPVAKVTLNSSGLVTAIQDMRQMWLRLGRGGSSPNIAYAFPWTGGRSEGTSGTTIFTGGDKELTSDKDWRDAIMTRLWEIGGGQYWYSANADRDVKLLKGQPVLVATGDNFQWTLGSNTLQWASLSFTFANSVGIYNDVADGSNTLLDGQCLYVDLDRTTNRSGGSALTPQVANLATLGTPVVPGSRYIIAWRKGNNVFIRDRDYEVGRTISVATTAAQGTVRLTETPGNISDPLVVPVDANGTVAHTATAGNSPAFQGTGIGSGPGVKGIGGGTDGIGVFGVGGVTNGIGVKGTGRGSGAGVVGDGSNGTGVGGNFIGGGGSAGATAVGSGSAAGFDGTGGNTNGIGVKGTGGITNGIGVQGNGTGTGTGVVGIASGHNVGGVSFDSVAMLADASARGTGLRVLATAVGLSPDAGAAIRIEETQATNARQLPIYFLHPTLAPGGLGGVTIASDKIADGDVDLVFGHIVPTLLANPIGSTTVDLRMDVDLQAWAPEADGTWKSGTIAKRWSQVNAASYNAATSGGAAVVVLDDTGLDVNGSTKLASATTAVHNKLVDRNIPKAAIKFKVESNGTTLTITGDSTNNGWNVNAGPTTTTVSGRDYLHISFPQAFFDKEYLVDVHIGYDEFANASSTAYGNLKVGMAVVDSPDPGSSGAPFKSTTDLYLFFYNRITATPQLFSEIATVMTANAPIWVTVICHGKQ